jgi:hypothetical protein
LPYIEQLSLTSCLNGRKTVGFRSFLTNFSQQF